MPDIYADIRAFAAEAQQGGLDGLATQLVQAIESGSSATEILMEVRWVLRGGTGAMMPRDLATARKNLIGRINGLLR